MTPVKPADTVLTSSALVPAMIVPGFALFYGGLVRSENVLGSIMNSIVRPVLSYDDSLDVIGIHGIGGIFGILATGLLASQTVIREAPMDCSSETRDSLGVQMLAA